MRLLADENCDRLIVTVLRAAGHDVAFISEGERGIDDTVVVLKPKTENRILLTDDLDFGRLLERQQSFAPTIFCCASGWSGGRPGRIACAMSLVAMMALRLDSSW